LTEQQPKQERILNTKLDYNDSIMVDWTLFIAIFQQKIRHFRDNNLSSRNQSGSRPVPAAKFNAAGARPTL